MTKPNEQEFFDDILNALLSEVSEPDHATLTEWIRRYPQYSRELTEFAVSRSLAESLPRSPQQAEIDEDTLVLRGMSILQNVLYQQTLPLEEQHDLVSILKEGRARGLELQDLAQQTQLSVALVRKLDRRLILFASLPKKVIEVLARVIHCNNDALAHYLQQAPLLPQHASYHAKQAPKLTQQERFFDALRADSTITEANRAYWLTFAEDGMEE
jgi:hypothetical protein